MKTLTITYVVSSESSEKLRNARQLAVGSASPERLFTDIATAKDKTILYHHRLGDYFSEVNITDSGPTSFQLDFVPCQNADRYWKDLVVKILKSIKDSGVSVRSAKHPSRH